MVREGYKQTEVGEIPEDWDVCVLGDCLKASPKYGINAPAVPLDRNIPVYIRITDISENGRFTPDPAVGVDHPESGNYLLKVGDLVLARTGASVGKSYMYRESDGALVYAGFLIKVSPDHIRLDSSFLSQFVSTEVYWRWIRLMSMRSGQPGVNGNEYAQLPIPLPSLIEQEKIAKALSDVDELIVSLEKLIAKKRDIKTAMMQQLLTGKKRLPGFGEGKGYKRTELGEIPEDWDVKSYGDIFDFFTTATNSRSDLSDKGSHYYIHYGDIHTEFDYVVDFDSSVIPRIQSERISSASLLKDGDLLMADASEDYEGIGKSVEVRNLGVEKAVSGLHTFLLRDKEETFLDGYRGYLHTITCVKKSFDRLATGLKVYGLSKNNLKQVLIPIPSKDEQREIIAILVSMREEIQCLVDRMKKTKAIKQGMMQELLTGRTRLVDVDAATQDEEERMHGT